MPSYTNGSPLTHVAKPSTTGGGNKPDTPCAGCGKLLYTSTTSLPAGQRMCRPCRSARRAGQAFTPHWSTCGRCNQPMWKDNGRRRCCDTCRTARRNSRDGQPRPRDTRIIGRPRRRLAATIRAMHKPCPMCGHTIDQTLPRTGRRHPLSSVIDEWLPRSKGGDVTIDNCVELHSICNATKANHWPITPELQAKCEQRVLAILNDTTPTISAL